MGTPNRSGIGSGVEVEGLANVVCAGDDAGGMRVDIARYPGDMGNVRAHCNCFLCSIAFV